MDASPPGAIPFSAVATAHGQQFTRGYIPIEYEHIRPLRYYRDAVVRIEAVNATFASTLKVGYIRGVGDNVRPMLQELGIPVTELDPSTLAQTNLSQFTAIVIGSRAYESTSAAALVADSPRLLKFARDGGTIVTQYGKSEMALPGILPFPITLTQAGDRVTDETAPVRVLDLGSPLLTTPNHIGESDFANWVQERSLYMPHTFDKEWRDAALDERQERSAERRLGAPGAGRQGRVRLHDAVVLPAAAGRQSWAPRGCSSTSCRPIIRRRCVRPLQPLAPCVHDLRFAARCVHRRRGDSHDPARAPTWRS